MAKLEWEGEAENDYVYVGEGIAWVSVGDITIAINTYRDRVIVDLYRAGTETEDPLSSAVATMLKFPKEE